MMLMPSAFHFQDLLNNVKDFQKEAQSALDDTEPDSQKLIKLIDLGVRLDVDLPEIPRLKQVRKDS